MATNPITVRPMTVADVPLGMRFKTIAGWNQTAADWQMLLDAGTGFVALANGVPVGAVTVVTYNARFSWIGMLLVDPTYRHRGAGTTLLREAIAIAKPFGPVYLDATPQGKPLYERLGFTSVGEFVRMGRKQPSAFSDQPSAGGTQLAAIKESLLTDIVQFDAEIFGADRASILGALYRNGPQYAYCATRNARLAGYCLGRPGSDFEQIGPIVAEGLDTAKALLLEALQATAGRDVIVDVPVRYKAWRMFLSDLGFVDRRPFTRMVLGKPVAAGQPDKQFTIAGPEIG